MSQDLDYEPDILKFKQVWGNTTTDNKKQYQKQNHRNMQQPDPKNLQTIQSNNKRKSNAKIKQKVKQNKNQHNIDDNQFQQQKKNKSKNYQNSSKGNKNIQKPKTVYSSSNVKSQSVVRNPRPDKPEQVIEVCTEPKQFYTSYKSNNQKNNKFIQSHLTLAHGKDYQNQTASSNKMYPSHMNHHELKNQLSQKDYQLSLLRITNQKNQDRIRYLQNQVSKREQIIQQYKRKQRKYIMKNCQLQSKQFNFDYGKVQYQNFKNDSRRLLKMLQNTAQYKVFAQLAMDDNGVRFLHNINKDKKGKLDILKPQKSSTMMHFCTCNKAFIPQASFWVPEKIYSFGRQFIKARQGQSLSQNELQLMLYELNKIWRQRQKKIVNSLQALKGHEVGKYKRQIQNMTSRDKYSKNKKSMSTVENNRGIKQDHNNNKQQQHQGIQQ